MIHHYIPGRLLAPFIDVVWVTEAVFRSEGMERVLPTGTMQIIINLHGAPILTWGRGDNRRQETIDTAIVAGAHMDYLIIDPRSVVRSMGIVFKPGGAAPFFSPPLKELKNQRIPLDVLWGAEAGALRAQLLEAETPRQCFLALECFLERKVQHNCSAFREYHPFIEYTVSRLSQAPGENSLDQIRNRCGYGTTRFPSLFSQAVGLTPKQFSRVQRFQQVINALFRRQVADWPDMALRYGYYDQAHFINEFKAFTGITPGDYFNKRSEDMNHLSL